MDSDKKKYISVDEYVGKFLWREYRMLSDNEHFDNIIKITSRCLPDSYCRFNNKFIDKAKHHSNDLSSIDKHIKIKHIKVIMKDYVKSKKN